MAKGKKLLIVTGIVQIIIGIVSFLLIWGLLKYDGDTHLIIGINTAEGALFDLILLYLIAGYHIIAGILAIIYSSNLKASYVLLVIGISLCVLTSIGGNTVSGNSVGLDFINNYFRTLIPVLYSVGAILNIKSIQSKK